MTPTTLYAGTDRGMFKSTNGGGNWGAVNTGLTGMNVHALAIDPTTPATLYVGTFLWGVFRSTNGGANWSATGLPAYTIYALAIDPVTPATLYAGTERYGVFKSTNGGANWSAINTGLPSSWPEVYALAIDPVTPTTLYAGTHGDGVFKSTNGGGNWSAVNTGLTATYVYALAIDPASPVTLYAGTSGGGVFKSTDGGATWSAFNAGLTAAYVYVLAIDPATPITLYAGTNSGGVFAMQMHVPATPEVSVSRSGVDILLDWDPVTIDTQGEPTEVINYRVYVGLQPYFDPDSVTPAEAPTNQYRHEGVYNVLTNYYYIVRAMNIVGASAGSWRIGKVTYPVQPGQN